MPFDLGGALERLRPWALLIFNGGLLAIVFRFYVDNRRLRLAEKSRSEDFTLQVSADGRSNLQFVIDNLVRDITAQRDATEQQRQATEKATAAHAQCEQEMTALLHNNRSLENKIDGLCRQFIAFSESVGRAIPPGAQSPEISAMMDQLAALATAARDEASS